MTLLLSFQHENIKDPMLLSLIKYKSAATGVFAYESITGFLISIILFRQECSFAHSYKTRRSGHAKFC